jgi:UDP-3-O-[3-hydroxymyristoyl] glucosamine N-acyltransferase
LAILWPAARGSHVVSAATVAVYGRMVETAVRGPIVVYGIGSPIVVDIAETCRRLNVDVVAWVKNIEGPTFQPQDGVLLESEDLPAGLTAHQFAVPLFTPGHRHAACEDARRRGFSSPASLVDPTAVVASSTELAAGCYVNAAVTIGAAGRIGRFVFINRSASIGHHAEIADFVSIGPGAVICGNVKICRGAVVGAGAVICPSIEVGANAVVAAGTVATRPVAPHTQVAGNVARVTKRNIRGYADRSV